jgi:hypothetical protein
MRRRLGPALIAAAVFSLVLSSFAYAQRIDVTLVSVTSP